MNLESYVSELKSEPSPSQRTGESHQISLSHPRVSGDPVKKLMLREFPLDPRLRGDVQTFNNRLILAFAVLHGH